jgi:transglutaminase-like putative cysteine protease
MMAPGNKQGPAVMGRTIAALLVPFVAAWTAPPALAQDPPAAQQVSQGPAPAWANTSEPLPLPSDAAGVIFVRSQDVVMHLDAKGESLFFSERVVLLQPQALQIGNVAVSWNPAAGTPVVHAIKIHRGTQTINVLQSTKFEILRREDQLETAVLTGTLTAVLKIPDLRVGDELEVAYTVPASDPTLKDQSAGVLSLAPTTPAGRYHVELNWDRGQEPRIRASEDLAGKLKRRPSAVALELDDPPTITAPKDAPPRYNWQRLIEYTDYADWAALSQRFAPLFAAAAKLAPGSPLKQEAARIAADHPDPMGRAQAALKLVQQQVRYVYIGLDGGNYLPATADQTWQRRYGDCKAKTVLLLALLGELGVPAEAVLVRNLGSDDGFDARLPNPGLFDHVLVRATIGGKSYWLDGTLPAVATPSTAPDFPYRWALPLAAAGHGLEAIPWSPPRKPDTLELYEIDARAGLDKPARIATTSIKRGPQALAEYAQFSVLTGDQLLQAFRASLTGGSSWNSIETVKYRFDEGERASVLEITGTGPIDWDTDTTPPERSLALPGGGFSPPDRRQRAADQDQKAPFYNSPDFSCHVTTVRLPAGTKPGAWYYNTTYDTAIYGQLYYRAFDLRDGSLRMIRGSRAQKTEIDPVQAQRDNARLAGFDNSMAWLRYDPARTAAPEASAEPVPATFEGDWLHSATACLPKDLR